MNIIDEIHAQFNAFKLVSEYYVKYIFLFFIMLAMLIANDEQKPILYIMSIILFGLNKVIIADLSPARISSVWRVFRVPILPRSVIARDVKQITLNAYESIRSDGSIELRYKISCYVLDGKSPQYVYSTHHYDHAKVLCDWLAKRLQISVERSMNSEN